MIKNVILAGASGNLGYGVLKTLLSKSYDHFFVFLREGKSLSIDDPRITIIRTKDLSQENNVREAFSIINPDRNTVFYLFSSVGGYTGGRPLWEYSEEELSSILKLNLFTSFLLSKYFALLVKESAAGSICLTSALASIRPEAQKSIYSLSKSALNSMIKTFSLEGKNINLTVNAIAPYIIDSPENREWVKDVNLLINPEEIGELVHSFFENYKYMNGNIVELKHKLNL